MKVQLGLIVIILSVTARKPVKYGDSSSNYLEKLSPKYWFAEKTHKPSKLSISGIDYLVETAYQMASSSSEKAAEQLGWFVKNLQSFSTEIVFDYTGFSRAVPMLEAELELITTTIEEVSQYNRVLSDQLRFARYVFGVLVDTSEGLRLYDPDRGVGPHWVYCVLRINIRIMTMNEATDPNIRSIDYANAVLLHYQYLEFWKDMLKYLTDVPLLLRLMVDRQVTEAERILHDTAGSTRDMNVL